MRQYYRDRYAVSDRVLGSGQYGKVYLAHEVSTWRQLACKIVELNEAARQLAGLHNTSTRDDSLTHDPLRWIEERRERQKAMREIEILSKLSHVSILLSRLLLD
jgi:serine/threonine protein kinase